MRLNNSCLKFMLMLCLLVQHLESRATHVFGGELLYTYVSGYTYHVTLTLYGDCSASAPIFNSLYTATPLLLVYNGASVPDSFAMQGDTLGTEVSPVCPAELSQTSCNGGTLPGVRKFAYSCTVTLSGASADWRFVFPGNMGPSSSTGRSHNLTNIYNGGSTLMTVEADLNNLLGPNSSPRYSAIPTPFFCVNIGAQYNQGAIDPNGDSLVFSLVPGFDFQTQGNVNYVAPFSASNPLSTVAGAFSFSSLNGQMSFTPDVTQDALVVNRVDEYRHGVFVGSSEREMTFVVLSNCTGTPPSLNMTKLVGGTVSSGNVINLCVGASHLSFSLSLVNPDGDTTQITYNNLPAGAMLDTVSNNTPEVLLNFSWNTGALPVGVYTFYLTIKNKHCPIANNQTVAYTINVVPVLTVSAKQLSLTECVHPASVEVDLAYGFLPRVLEVLEGGTVVKVFSDSTGIVMDSLPSGNYTFIASSDSSCSATTSLSISDSGQFHLLPYNESYCVGDRPSAIYIPPVDAGATINWYDAEGNALPGPPTPNTADTGSSIWSIVEQYKVCSSNKVPVNVVVHPLPDVKILSLPVSSCYGDTIYLQASGGTTYIWAPDSLVFDSASNPFIRVTVPVSVTVHGTDQYGCRASASASYTDIQQCCLFTYPNAFTPNGDGLNDGFRVINFGNLYNYRLTIYDRWGAIVFDTADPKERWDGRHNGLPCAMGTYYYYFKAKCLTGPSEVHKGDVTLIR